MKKILLVGTFILSAISFANTTTKAEISEANNIKIESMMSANESNSQGEDWWIQDRQRDRGSDKK